MGEHGDYYPDANSQLPYLPTIFERLANTRRCLNFSRSGGILPLPVLAFLAVQTHKGPAYDENDPDSFVCFAQAYAAPWQSMGTRKNQHYSGARWVHRLRYQIRCFVVTSQVLDDGTRAASSFTQEQAAVGTGLKLDRRFAQSSQSFPLRGRTLCIEEVRAALALTEEQDLVRPLYSIICLADSDRIFSATREIRKDSDDRLPRWQRDDFKGKGLTGINEFLAAISVWLEDWAAAWNSSLDEIDNIVSVDVRPLPVHCHIPSASDDSAVAPLCRPT